MPKVAGPAGTMSAANGAIIRGCTTCHAGHYDQPLNHPGGQGTPVEKSATDPSSACVVCHMVTVQTTGGPLHFFRINPDPNYSTFPTLPQWTAGQKMANTAFDTKGNYANAVWVDVDLACGQCHGGGTAAAPSYPVISGAPYFTKATLGSYAAGMHGLQASYTGPAVGTKADPGVPTTPPAINTKPSASNTVTKCTTINDSGCVGVPALGFVPGWTVAVVDSSTAQNGAPNCSVTVTWGDGTSTGAQSCGHTFSHSYSQAGTYAVLETVTDTVNYLTASAVPAEVSVPVTRTVKVTVTDTTSGTCSVTTTKSCNIDTDCATGQTCIGSPLDMAAVYLYGQSGKQYAGLTIGSPSVATILHVQADTYGVRVVKGSYTCTLSSPSISTMTIDSTSLTAECYIQ